MSSSNGIISRLFRGKGEGTGNGDQNNHGNSQDYDTYYKTNKVNGSHYVSHNYPKYNPKSPYNMQPQKKPVGTRRRCISPEVRRRMVVNSGDTHLSAPGAMSCSSAENSVKSTKSAPTAEFPFRMSEHQKPIQSIDLGPVQRHNGKEKSKKEKSKKEKSKKEKSKKEKSTKEKSSNSHPKTSRKSNSESKISFDPMIEKLSGNGTDRPRRRHSAHVTSREDHYRHSEDHYRHTGNDKSVGVRTCQSMESHQLLFRRKSNEVKSNVKVPKGEITVVITDVEGSTKLWEVDGSAMKEALDLHDRVVRKCYTNHNGYEILTEGDSFHLAFQHPLDALSFALQLQFELYNADWSDRILSLRNGRLDKVNTMRGLRVRVGLHHGPSTSYEHEVTQRTYYRGEAFRVAQAIERSSHGGQIVTTVETWKAVSGMAERYLGSPQVVDCGEHELDASFENGSSIIIQKLVQLVPKRFAYDYFTYRGNKGKGNKNIDDPNKREGRMFPALKTSRQINTAFYNAPYKNNEAIIVFVYTVSTNEDLSEEKKSNNATRLSQYIRTQIILCVPSGYECQEGNGQWMLAFHTLESAVTFGVKVVKKLQNAPLKVKVGIQKGPFTSQGPHAVTGRADYFGKVVNRAARIASSAEVGQAILGVADDELDGFVLPSSETFKLEFLRTEKFKGVTVITNLYRCTHK